MTVIVPNIVLNNLMQNELSYEGAYPGGSDKWKKRLHKRRYKLPNNTTLQVTIKVYPSPLSNPEPFFERRGTVEYSARLLDSEDKEITGFESSMSGTIVEFCQGKMPTVNTSFVGSLVGMIDLLEALAHNLGYYKDVHPRKGETVQSLFRKMIEANGESEPVEAVEFKLKLSHLWEEAA